MAKQINFTFEGIDYTLEYSRRIVQNMERAGIVVTEASDKPMTTLPEIFAWGFAMHHPKVKRELINKIFKNIKKQTDDETGLFDKLSEMILDTYETLLGEEDSKNAITWTANF